VREKVSTVSSLSLLGQKVEDFKLLVKFRLTLTVVFTSMMAFVLASPGAVEWGWMFVLALGGFLVTGAANALNQVLEKDYDKLMTRTENRPIAAGRMTVSQAVLWAGFMSLGGIVFLAMFNVWAAFFGMLALVSYAFIYTPLKRVSPIAIPVGAFPGALPMLIGAVAVQGELTTFAITLFTIQFFWQFPHFWAIGWLGFDDYQKAGFKLVPAHEGQRDQKTGWYAFLYATFLVFVPFMFTWNGEVSMAAILVLALIGALYALYGFRLYKEKTRKAALQLMFASFFYLPLVLAVMMIDKFLF
jgi:protoheme IX farnesyltransferase